MYAIRSYYAFINNGIADADSLAKLLGFSTAAAVGGGQAHVVCAGDVMKTISVAGASGALYDRVILRNRLIPSVVGGDLSQSEVAQNHPERNLVRSQEQEALLKLIRKLLV